MRNIFSDLPFENQRLPEVEVLLATFNGEAFIAEFLESLLQQEGVRIHLRVSDDGSTDETLEIVKTYEDKFESFKILIGPAKGPNANFLYLIEESSHEYVALADQDDLWEKEKLITQISHLRGSAPQLICHDRRVIDVKGSEIRCSQIRVRVLNLKNALVENVVFGNTILLNQQGVDLIRSHKSSNLFIYDSYIYLIFSCFGQITFIQKPLTDYRLHNNNLVGIPNTYLRFKNFSSNLQSFYHQNKTFFDLYRDEIRELDTDLFIKYFQIFERKNRIVNTLKILRTPIKRQKNLQTLAWKILTIIYGCKRLDFKSLERKSSM
jgi:rhamnosyltransferase